MISFYKINFKSQFNSFKPELFSLFISIACAFLFILIKDIVMSEDYVVFAIFLSFYLLLLSPVIILHISYYLKNKGLELTINYDKEEITLNDHGKIKSYTFSEIVHSEKNLNIYYKNKLDGVFRKSNPWKSYGYIKLRFNNGDSIFITSLMTNINKLPITCNETNYTLVPILRNKEWETIKFEPPKPNS